MDTNQPYQVVAFYKFVELPDYQDLQPIYKAAMEGFDIKGTLLLAPEGVNATISALPANMDKFMGYIQSDPRINSLTTKTHQFSRHAFGKAKVKCRTELVSLGEYANPLNKTGQYVKPQDWNKLINSPNTITIDTRNDYEVEIGKFKNAVNPSTKRFNGIGEFVDEQLADDKDKNIAMYCTGGIRCEKFSSYLLDKGYKNVYHLEGGILNYLEQVPEAESTWDGLCYVFDERMGVDHNLQAHEELTHCKNCGSVLFTKDRIDEYYIAGKQCNKCA